MFSNTLETGHLLPVSRRVPIFNAGNSGAAYHRKILRELPYFSDANLNIKLPFHRNKNPKLHTSVDQMGVRIIGQCIACLL